MDSYINSEIVQDPDDDGKFAVQVNAYVGGLTYEEAEDISNLVEEDLKEDMFGESS